MSDSEYQGVFIFLLCLNLLFWLIIACWRFCTLITIRTISFDRVVNRFHNMRYYLERRFFRRRVTRITNLNNLNGISNRNLDLNSDLPPTYEEALKYPYVSTICSNVQMNNHSDVTVLNLSESISNLDSLNLLNQIEVQRSGILLCSGDCNCLNHLRQNVPDHSTIVNVISHQIPESSSTATTSTIDSNLNTLTTIVDETPTSTNRDFIVETNFVTLPPTEQSILYQKSADQHLNQESNQRTNDKAPNDQQVLSVSNFSERAQGHLNRSSTFNDLQTYLKNIHR